MQEDRQKTFTNTDLLYRYAPGWLRLKVPAWLNRRNYMLVHSFVHLVRMVYQDNPPRGVIVRARNNDDILKFRLVFSAEYRRDDRAVTVGLVARQYGLASRTLKDLRSSPDWSVQLEMQKAESRANRQKSIMPSESDATLLANAEIPEEVEVFNLPESLKDGGRSKGRDLDTAKRMDATLAQLIKTGSKRPLMMPPADWKKGLEELRTQFPNFRSVVDTVVLPHLTMLSLGMVQRMQPVLLVGEPGIGKTFFAQALAEVLGVSAPFLVPMAAETNGGTLAGSSSFWSNASPGALFECLAWGRAGKRATANPLVVLDEIDKVSTDRYDARGALYSLLEVETAKVFEDQALPDIQFDASLVRFVLTANDLDRVPKPLQSRMLVFAIEPPNRDQLESVVLRIYQQILHRLGLQWFDGLPHTLVEVAVKLSPRESKMRLECAVAMALGAGRRAVIQSDWPDVPAASASKRRAIGFGVH